MAQEQYLGDGLYASFDGFQIILRAPRAGGDHWVGLEPLVFAEMVRWMGTIKSAQFEAALKVEQGWPQ